VECESVRILETHRPDRLIQPGGLRRKGIVDRNRSIPVDAEYFAQPVSEGLRVWCIGILAHGHIELAVRSEVDRAAVMVGGAQALQVQDRHFAAGHCHIAICPEPADPIVDRRSGRRVINIDVAVDGEIGIERHTQEAALAKRVDVHGEEGGRQQRAVLDHSQTAVLLANEDPAVGREGYRRRRV
jgi:hypothetical protein